MYRKVSILEKYCSQFLGELTTVKEKLALASHVMNEADTKGSFSSDDEIGSVFKLIKDCINFLNDETAVISNPNDETR